MDTIADLFVQISNAKGAGKKMLELPFSRMKAAILKVMKEEGYIAGFKEEKKSARLTIDISSGKSFKKIVRVSKPSRRFYVKSKNIPRSKSGFGTVIVSTPRGILTGEAARRQRVGGEIICEVY